MLTLVEHFIKGTPIEEVAKERNISLSNAKSNIGKVRRRLQMQGWVTPGIETDHGYVFGKPIPPDGMDVDAYIAKCKQNITESTQVKREAEIRSKGEDAGRPILSWREMAILGWDNERAQKHRNTISYLKADQKLQEARRKLRDEGWTFRLIGNRPVEGIPPPGKIHQYSQEIADAQRRSNWLMTVTDQQTGTHPDPTARMVCKLETIKEPAS